MSSRYIFIFLIDIIFKKWYTICVTKQIVFQIMEENIMKKITEERAVKLIEKGIYPKCVITSKGDYIFVTSVSELSNLKQLGDAGVQKFELFEVYTRLNVPDGADELSFDDAFNLLCSDVPSSINVIMYDGTSLKISSKNELVSFYRSQIVRKEPFAFYK